jgi:hypothetical protein
LVAGRVRQTEDLLRSFAQVGLCNGSPAGTFVESVERYIAQSADVLADGDQDGKRRELQRSLQPLSQQRALAERRLLPERCRRQHRSRLSDVTVVIRPLVNWIQFVY